MRHFSFIAILISILIISSCRFDKGKNIPDVSNIDIDLKINRFEQDFFSIDTNNVSAGMTALEQKYPEFAPIFFENVLVAYDKRIAPDGPDKYIEGILKHKPLRKLYDTCQIVYKDFSSLEKDLTKTLKYYNHHFPEATVPSSVTTFISEFGYGGFIYGEDDLAVGIEFFLGSDFPYLQWNQGNSNFSNFLTRSYNKDHLVSKTIAPLVNERVGSRQGNKLLQMMIINGKKRYILEQLLPHAPDSVVQEFSGKQIKWLEENESLIWAYFLEKNLLYSSRLKEIKKYVNPSPHSPGMPKEAPGNTGSWIGYKIVQSYMKQHPNVSLTDLIKMENEQKILELSKYKPRY